MIIKNSVLLQFRIKQSKKIKSTKGQIGQSIHILGAFTQLFILGLKQTKNVLSSECPGSISSVDAGDDPVADSSAVLVPRRAVLPPALAHVTRVSVYKQDDEVDHVVPRQEVAETCSDKTRPTSL